MLQIYLYLFFLYLIETISTAGLLQIENEDPTLISFNSKLTQPRRLSSLCGSVSNCQYCSYDICYQCEINRVVPSCDCKYGYYSNGSGVCQPCIEGCKICSNSSTCLTCKDEYTLSNNICTCSVVDQSNGICNDPNNLYFTTEIGVDLQSVIISFNHIISIFSTQPEDIFPNFQKSFDNCTILSPQTLQNYGISSSDGSCYIDKSYQNRFVVNLGTTNTGKQSILPVIELGKIFIQSGVTQISPLKIITNETQIGIQLNVLPKLCSLQQSAYSFNLQDKINNKIQTFNSLVKSTANISCKSNPSKGSNFITSCDATNGIYFDSSSLKLNESITIVVQCNWLFNLTSIDQATFTVTSQKYSINNMPQDFTQLSIKPYNDLNILENTQSLTGQLYIYTVQSFPPLDLLSIQSTLGLASYVQKVDQKTKQITKDSSYLFQVNGSIKDSSVNIHSQSLMLFVYQSNFDVSVTASQGSDNMNPAKMLQLRCQITDYDTIELDINSFTYDWYCQTETTNEKCTGRNGKEFIIPSYMNTIIPANTLRYNQKVKFTLIAKRKSNAYSSEIKRISFQTATAKISLKNNALPIMYYSEQNQIVLSYSNSLYTDAVQCSFRVILVDNKGNFKAIVSPSPLITFMIYDYFSNIDLNTSIYVSFSVYDSYLNDNYQEDSLSQEIQFVKPPLGCQINLSSDKSFTDNTVSLKGCILNGQTYYYQFFYYLSLAEQKEEIQSNNLNRRMLSTTSISNEIVTSLPPGNLIIMVTVNSQTHFIYNFTLPVTISENKFSQTEYETFLTNQYSKGQLYQQSNHPKSEIFAFELFLEAVEYYELNEDSYKPSSQINLMKISIIERLSSIFWVNQSNEIYLLSTQINQRMKKTNISISTNISESLKEKNFNSIGSVLESIKTQTSFTQIERQQYQSTLSTSYKDLILNMNNIDQWNSSNNLEAILASVDIMNGITQTMVKNQQPVKLEANGVNLEIGKYDYANFMMNYYPDKPISLDNSNLTYFVLTQTWSSTHPIFRDEISAINSASKQNTTDPAILELLEKKYPVIIPEILTDNSTRRMLKQSQANLNNPLKIKFGVISQKERITCVQKNSVTGKWVSNSCDVYEEIINNERHISCSCSKPTVTSLITDVSELFNNQNVRDLFSENGFLRVFTLPNWYEYAPIWTILGLNLGLIVLIIIGCKYDKIDQQSYVKKAFLQNRRQKMQQNLEKESIFMQILNQKIKLEQNNIITSENIQKNKTSLDKNITLLFQPIANQGKNIGLPPLLQSKSLSQQEQSVKKSKKYSAQITIQKQNDFNQDQCQETLSRSDTHTPNNRLIKKQENLKENHLDQIQQVMQTENESIRNIQDQQKQNENSLVVTNNNNDNKNNLQVQQHAPTLNQIFEEQDIEVISLGFNNYLNQEFNKQSKITPVEVNQYTLSDFQFSCEIQSNNIEQSNLQQQLNDGNVENNIQAPIEEDEENIKTDHNMIEEANIEELMVDQITESDNNNNKYQNIQIAEDNQHNKEGQYSDKQSQQINLGLLDINLHIDNKEQHTEDKITNQVLQSQNTLRYSQKEEEIKEKKKREEQQVNLRFQKSKIKLREYLSLEGVVKATFSFHIFLSTFIIYDARFSRVLRFLIYYNKLIQNLAINALFGVNLSIIQLILLSLFTTIALQIVTTILTVLCRYKKLLFLVFTFTTLFNLFCYYSVLVAASGQTSYNSNVWIGKYFLNIILQEFIIGVPVSFAMYYICKRFFDKLIIPILFELLGAGIIMQAFQY